MWAADQGLRACFPNSWNLEHKRDNALVVCHALTGSADVEDWSVYTHCAKPFDQSRCKVGFNDERQPSF